MFGNERNIDQLEALYNEIKQYVELKTEIVKLDTTEKLTLLLSKLILTIVLILLGAMALFYFSFMVVYAIDSYLHNLVQSFAIVGGILLIISLWVYCMRRRLIVQPIVNYLGKLLLEKGNKKP